MSSTSRGLSAGTFGQLTCGAGATLALISPIWFPLAGAGLVLLVLGVILSAPSAGSRGPYLVQWWNVLALSALVCLAGFGLELLLPVVGGILITAGGVVALVAVALGTPPEPGDAEATG